MFACKPPVRTERIWSVGRTRGSWQPGRVLTVAVFHNSPVQQLKRKATSLCISTPHAAGVSEARKQANAGGCGCRSQSHLWFPVPLRHPAGCRSVHPTLFRGPVPDQPMEFGVKFLHSLPECCRAQPRDRGSQPRSNGQQRLNPDR